MIAPNHNPTRRLTALTAAAALTAGALLLAPTPAAANTALPFSEQYADPVLVSALVGGSDVIPVDAAGIGGDHLRRLPQDPISSIEAQIAADMVAAFNYEREARGLFPFVHSANIDQLQHRWVKWLGDNREQLNGGCPQSFFTTSCHSAAPNWVSHDWYNPGVGGISEVGGIAYSGPGRFTAGTAVNGWMVSAGHRNDVLGLDGRFVGVGISCMDDGTTYLEATMVDFDGSYVTASPETYTGSDVTPITPIDFGRRCPQPGAAFEVTGVDGGLTINPEHIGASLQAGRHEIGGPLLAEDNATWRWRARVFDGTVEVAVEEWAIFATSGSYVLAPPHTISGLSNGVTYTVELDAYNAFETTQTTTNTGTPTPAPTTTTTVPTTTTTPTTTIPTTTIPTTVPDAEPTRFTAFGPVRQVDTRSRDNTVSQGGLLYGFSRDPEDANNFVRRFALPDVPPTATAVTVNIAAVSPTGGGFFTLFGCGAPIPETSSINFDGTRLAIANQVTVAITASEVCVASLVDAHIVIDLNGWWEPGGEAEFAPQGRRLWDSREQGGANSSDGILEIDLTGWSSRIGDLSGVSIGLVSTETPGLGFLTAFPCALEEVPNASSLNYVAGRSIPNHVTVAIPNDDRRLCIYQSSRTEIVVDLTGWWTGANTGQTFTGFTPPVRELDTRRPGQLVTHVVGDELADTMVMAPREGTYLLNVVPVSPDGDGWIAVYACDAGWQGTSTVNYMSTDHAVATATIVDASSGVCARSMRTVELVIDSYGTLTNQG